MTATIYCCHLQQAAESGAGASSAYLNFSNSVDLQSLISSLSGINLVSTNFSTDMKRAYADAIDRICTSQDCNYVLPGWQYPYKQCIKVVLNSVSDKDYWDNNIAGRSLTFIVSTTYTYSGNTLNNVPIFNFKCSSLPSFAGVNGNTLVIASEECLLDNVAFNQANGCALGISYNNYSRFTDSSISIRQIEGVSCFDLGEAPVSCEDEKTSLDNQQLHFIISDGVSTVQDFDVDFDLRDGANQEIYLRNILTVQKYNDIITCFNSPSSLIARVGFRAGVTRSSCNVKLVCAIYRAGVSVGVTAIPPFVDINADTNGYSTQVTRNLIDADFEPCSDLPVSITENLSSYVEGLLQDRDFSVGFDFIQIIPIKVVITNCSALIDYCCDDVDEPIDDEITISPYSEPLIKGYGGSDGGDNVDLTCVCNALVDINNSLNAFKTANQTALEGISDTLAELNIDIDNQCICDNLEDVVEGLEAIKDSIDDKELSVSNTINPPVNNVSVSSPVNNVSVTVPTTELNTIANRLNPLQGINAALDNMELIQDSIEEHLKCNKDGEGIACILADTNNNISDIANSLVCGNDGIACVLQDKNISVDLNTTDITNGLEAITDKLDDINTSVHDGLINSDDESNLENISNSLNTSDDEPQSLADVIKDKEMGFNIDVEVSPADDVNINRVYYTNQRNGDTQI